MNELPFKAKSQNGLQLATSVTGAPGPDVGDNAGSFSGRKDREEVKSIRVCSLSGRLLSTTGLSSLQTREVV